MVIYVKAPAIVVVPAPKVRKSPVQPEKRVIWDSKLDGVLIKLWNEGQSASFIGRALGVSRCSVIGRKDRLAKSGVKLAPRISFGRRKKTAMSPPKPRKPRYKVAPPKKPKVNLGPQPPTPPPVDDTVGLVPFNKVRMDQCKWIAGDPKRTPIVECCGKPVAAIGKPYCAAHMTRAYNQ